jgi:hypothetical protein
MGSKTPITHALSWYILSVIDLSMGHRRTAGWPLPLGEASLALHCNHRPRYWLEDMGACCWFGQGTTPHLPGVLPE